MVARSIWVQDSKGFGPSADPNEEATPPSKTACPGNRASIAGPPHGPPFVSGGQKQNRRVDPSNLAVRQTANPSIPGIITSKMATPNRCPRRASKASAPLLTSTTLWPSLFKFSANICRNDAVSSASRMRTGLGFDCNFVMMDDAKMKRLSEIGKTPSLRPGMELTDLQDGVVRKLPVDSRTHQPYGLLHGGASVVLPKPWAAWAPLLVADQGKGAVGVEVNANHVKGVRDGWVHGTATLAHKGAHPCLEHRYPKRRRRLGVHVPFDHHDCPQPWLTSRNCGGVRPEAATPTPWFLLQTGPPRFTSCRLTRRVPRRHFRGQATLSHATRPPLEP